MCPDVVHTIDGMAVYTSTAQLNHIKYKSYYIATFQKIL